MAVLYAKNLGAVQRFYEGVLGPPIKLVIDVASLATTRELAPQFGGALNAAQREWTYRGARVCDGQDPEGNVFQCREKTP
jgi:predicted enzyme related to lactoylglutathione lyase